MPDLDRKIGIPATDAEKIDRLIKLVASALHLPEDEIRSYVMYGEEGQKIRKMSK